MDNGQSPIEGESVPNGNDGRALVTVHARKKDNPTPVARKFKLTTLRAVRREMSRIYARADRHEMTYADACRAVFILSNIGKILELTEIEARLRKLETIEGVKHGVKI